MGKVIETDGESAIVVGVIKKAPKNSTLVFKYVIPFSYDKINTNSYGWGRFMFSTYIQLNDQANIDSIGARLTRYALKEKCGYVVNGDMVFKLQKFSQIHLDGNHGDWRFYYNLTDKKYVIAFSIIALFILINACFNYINLSTARSERRSKEVGVRKVVGASYKNIFSQFMGESLLTSFISILIACLGILGLTIFIAERKTKEIGIRKVNGASIWNIIWSIIGKFMIWVSVAFVLAIPISYIMMEEVLMKYSYRVSIGFVDYLIALFIVVFVTISTSIYQAYKAATSNPVDSLRCE